jgi:integrase
LSEPIADKYRIVTENTEERLSEKELVDHRSEMESFTRWLDTIGKEPTRAEGYAYDTIRATVHRIDVFYRWIWDREGGYVAPPTHEDADEYIAELARKDHTNAHKSSTRKSILRYFNWRSHERGGDGWETEMRFPRSNPQPRDYLTADERPKIRRAALAYGSVPERYDLPREGERDEVERYLAQRFEVSKGNVGDDEWERANSWLVPSLVWVSLDAGLRPVEVRRATTGWVDVQNEVLRIPMEESSKNADNWTVALQERTAEAVERWLEQRSGMEEYEDTDALWLGDRGNEWTPSTLRGLLHDLCDIAGIETENRSMSWYTIRHSVGTYMTREEGLAAAQAQLRHRSPTTTMKYDQAPVEDRADALDRMG